MGFVLKVVLAGVFILFGLTARAETLGEALDAPELEWSATGWSVVTNVSEDGLSAVGTWPPNLAQHTLETTVTGITEVTFWCRLAITSTVNSRLEFYIDEALQARLGATTNWIKQSIYVPEGTHRLRWNAVLVGTPLETVYLDRVSLAAPEPVSIVTQPTNLVVDAGGESIFSVSASGAGPLKYQWFFNDGPMADATNSWIRIRPTADDRAGNYYVAVSNAINTVTSQIAMLTVTPLPPAITRQPVAQTNLLGTNVTFTVQASGSTPMQWQWLKAGMAIESATNSSLVLSNLQSSDFAGYQVIISNSQGYTTSQVATLALVLEPIFARHPVSKVAPTGATVQFSASVLSGSAPTWLWFHNGSLIPGATSGTLTVTNCRPLLHGQYWAVAANGYGSTTSAVARLSYSPVMAWGSNPVEISADFTNVIALAAGDLQIVGLRADGTLAFLNNGPGISKVEATNLVEATNMVGISAGTLHVLGLTAEGEVQQWGPLPPSYVHFLNYIPTDLTNVVSLGLGTGAQHGLALRSDGTVVDWRDRQYLADLAKKPIPPQATNIVAVAAGAYHSLALRADGTLVAWGDNRDKQLNIPREATNVVAIAAGYHNSIALRRDGKVVVWGQSNSMPPGDATNIVAVAGAPADALFLKADGRILSPGWPAPAWASNVVDIAAGQQVRLALVGDGPARISSHPVSRTVFAGDTVDVTARGVGAWPLSYQWYAGDTPIPGGTNWLLTITNVQPTHSALRVVVTNSLGAATSRVAAITVHPSALKVIHVPEFVQAETNGTVQITAIPGGSFPFTYQWRLHGTNLLDSERISGTTTDVLTISGVQYPDRGGYSVVVSDPYRSLTSSIVTVHFPATPQNAVAEALDVTSAVTLSVVGTNINWFFQGNTTLDGQDAAQSPMIVTTGNASIKMSAPGPGVVSFYWKSGNWNTLDGLTFYLRGYSVASISGQTGWERRSFVLNPGANSLEWRYNKYSSPTFVQPGAVWVDQVVFAEPPAVSVSPSSVITNEGGAVTLTAKATGTEPFSFQWQRYGTNVPGQASVSLTLGSTTQLLPGYYSVVVTNVAGKATSPAVPVLVLPANQKNHPWLTSTPEGALQVNWSVGTLEVADSLEGPWVAQPGATSPYVLQIGPGSKFCRVRVE